MKIDGLHLVNPADLAEYERAMRDEAIPAMIEDARRKVWPLIEHERENEFVGQDVMVFVVR